MDWTQIGLRGGIVVVTLGFLAYLKGERKDRKETRDSFLNTIENHMNHNTNATKRNTDVMLALHNWLKGRVGSCRFRGDDKE